MSDTLAPTHAVENTLISSAVVAGMLGWLPEIMNIIVATVGFVWFLICIKESRTFQHWIRNKQMKRNARRLMRLKAKEKLAVAKIAATETLRRARVEARELLNREIAEAAKLVAQNDAINKAYLLTQVEQEAIASLKPQSPTEG